MQEVTAKNCEAGTEGVGEGRSPAGFAEAAEWPAVALEKSVGVGQSVVDGAGGWYRTSRGLIVWLTMMFHLGVAFAKGAVSAARRGRETWEA